MALQTSRNRNHRALPVNRAEPYLMHIDLNSCFTTIEQQANPLIRNKPVAVAAYTTGNGMILAASYEAKALGIKLGVNVRQARQICPEIVVLMPDPPKYRAAYKLFKSVLLEYTSEVTPKSIDEFVIDFRGSAALRAGKTMSEIGYEIKQRLREEIGEYVSVNVGIGANRCLAKLAAGLHKPDGLDIIDSNNIEATLASCELMDLPGINRRFKARLFAAGITTPLEMYNADPTYLKNFVFFSKLGYYWHSRLRGWEVDDVEWGRKTIGHQYALQDKTYDRDQLCRILMKLSEKTGRRLRSNNYVARGVHLSLRFANDQYWHHGRKLERSLYATQDIYRAAADMMLGIGQFPDLVTHMSVHVFNLQDKSPEQLGLFDDFQLHQRRLAEAADIINDRYGEFTAIPAVMADMHKVVLDRIAFGSLRDMDEQMH
jgi:DNA polymerase-4